MAVTSCNLVGVANGSGAVGQSEFFVRFWGVRGSISTSDDETRKYGGNTSSLEIRCGERLLLFDAGTGIRYLGNIMMKSGGKLDADLFLTHTHFDHVCGIPFFTPFFISGNKFRLWAGHLGGGLTLKKVLSELMMAPLFPVPPDVFQSTLEFRDFAAGDTLTPYPDVTIRTTGLNHPNGATGYRVEFDGKSICYLTDTEHVVGQPDQNILSLIKDADVVIYDSMYTDDEYVSRVTWGHSTWNEGVRLCDAANVKTFVVFHHDPDHSDDFMDQVAQDVDQARPGSIVAREGLVIRP